MRLATLCGTAALAGLLVTAGGPAAAESPAADVAIPVSAEQQLAEQYAPVVMLQTQPRPCSDEGEPYAPMAVDALLENGEIALRQVGRGDPVVTWGPSGSSLYELGGGFYLDFPGNALDPGCVYERDYRRYTAAEQPTVYAHTVQQADRPNQYALQYWFFWYYNDWGNTHEGDWEGVQIVFPASSAAEALQVEPTSVGYAQHEGGERAEWSDAKLEREGSRIVVYPSAGSHASYFGSALYLGRSGGEGFGCDDTGGDTTRADPRVILLPDRVDEPTDPYAWLAFDGRWGERGDGPFNGPTGPTDKGRWTHPIDWQDGLRDSSVVVPGGDGAAESLAQAFCAGVAFGSAQLIAFKLSPGRALLTIGVLLGLVWLLIRRTAWSRVPGLPVVRSRSAGEILRAAPKVLRRAPLLFGAIAIAAVPLAALAGIVAGVLRALPLVGRLVTFTDGGDGTRLMVSLLVGSLANLVASTVAIAAVAWTMGELSAGRQPTARDVLGALGARARPLAGAIGRCILVVGVAMVTVVGIPFGIHRLVSYQFVPQCVMLEGLDGQDAPRRSVELVRGRWWRTAVVLGVIGAVFTLLAGAVAMALLVIARPPFWALSLFIGAAELVAVPIVAIAATLLYGAAAHDHAQPDPDGTEPDEREPAAAPV